MAFDVVDRHPAPATGGSEHGDEDQFEGGPLSHEPRDHLGAPALLFEGSLGQIGSSDTDAMSDRNPVDDQERVSITAALGTPVHPVMRKHTG